MEELENMEEIHEEELHEVDFHEEEKVKPKKKGKLLNILSNIVFIPVMAILVIYLIYALSIQKAGGVPSFFGQSYVRVLSGSMRKSGFERMDVVVIEKVKISQIKAADENEKNGSIIAFYASSKMSSSDEAKATLLTEKPANFKNFQTGKENPGTTIIFHQVIGIYYDNAGNTWFETKGTSNNVKDGTLVPGNYVIGQYVDSPMAGVIDFISSSRGMIMLIIIPSSVLLFLLLLNIIEIVDQMMREKKEKGALIGDVKERELEVTTIIEENSEEEEKKTRRRRKPKIEENTEE